MQINIFHLSLSLTIYCRNFPSTWLFNNIVYGFFRSEAYRDSTINSIGDINNEDDLFSEVECSSVEYNNS